MDRQTGRQACEQTDKQTGRQACGQADKQTDRPTLDSMFMPMTSDGGGHKADVDLSVTQTDMPAGRQACGQTDKHVDRQTSMRTDRQTDLGQHVHAHGVPGGGDKSDVDLSVAQRQRQLLETSKPASSKKVSRKDTDLLFPIFSQYQTPWRKFERYSPVENVRPNMQSNNKH